MAIIITMLLLGILLGFIGAGGAGFIIAILTLMFNVPIHTALGTSLTAMAFTCFSGVVSHYREGNITIKIGVIVGLFGAIGSFFGSKIAAEIPQQSLHWFTAGVLFLSTILLLVRLYIFKNQGTSQQEVSATAANSSVFIKAIFLGIVTGLLSGSFGIGSTPFIQLGLLTFLGLSIRQSVGTTMLVILLIAIGGGVGYNSSGYLDFLLLVKILIGTMVGAYIGAKFTNYAPRFVLKFAMVGTPAIAGFIMLFD
ncbi:sulfite exporter TauE/SafE family protein [Schinkia sp. CFF1]